MRSARLSAVTVAVVRGCTLAALLALAACAQAPSSAPPVIPAFAGSFETAPDPRLQADVLALDADTRALVRSRAGADDPRRRLQQVVALMQSPQQWNLRYAATATRTAEETLRSGEGNCLALSALFVALAREVGLDARFQDVELLPSWRQDGDVFVIERHINAVVMIGGEPLVVDFLVQNPGSAARSRLVPDRQMTAQYFNNIGVEHLAAGRLDAAYAFFRRSIETAPETAYLWTNLGVALSRNGQRDDAERAYAQALRLDRVDAVALSNLAGLYQAEGRDALAQSSLARVEQLRQSNPYYRYWQADRRYHSGDYAGAIRELRAAIELKPDDGALHFALARTYLRNGAPDLAARCLDDALRHAADAAARDYYEAQFRALAQAGHAP